MIIAAITDKKYVRALVQANGEMNPNNFAATVPEEAKLSNLLRPFVFNGSCLNFSEGFRTERKPPLVNEVRVLATGKRSAVALIMGHPGSLKYGKSSGSILIFVVNSLWAERKLSEQRVPAEDIMPIPCWKAHLAKARLDPY